MHHADFTHFIRPRDTSGYHNSEVGHVTLPSTFCDLLLEGFGYGANAHKILSFYL